MRCFCFILLIAISFFVSCQKIKQAPVDINTETKNPGEQTEKETDHDDILICGCDCTAANTNLVTWSNYLSEILELDSTSLETIPNGSYTVNIRFKIEVNGTLTDVTVEKDPGYGLGKKSLEAIKNYKGKWNPARESGRNISSYIVQPVKFIVDE